MPETKQYLKAQIEVLVDVEGEAEACDMLAEMLRPHMRYFNPESCFIDWHYGYRWFEHDGDGFEAVEQERLDAAGTFTVLGQRESDPRDDLSAADREELDRLVADAAVLIDDDGQNPEYTRGMAELIMLRMGWSSDHLDAIIGWIRDV